MPNRLTKYNAETGEYEYRERAKTQAEFNAQRKAVIQRLGELEDRIEQGKLLELPCAVGDTIWEVWAGGSDITEIQRGVRAIKVDFIYINQYDTTIHCISEEMTAHIPLSDFGKTIFLDRATAEAKVREMKGENDEQR